MSREELLAELAKLPVEERREIAVFLQLLDQLAALSAEERREIVEFLRGLESEVADNGQ